MKHKLLFFMAFFLPCLVFAQGNVSVKGSNKKELIIKSEFGEFKY
jgi:hypothetical protein